MSGAATLPALIELSYCYSVANHANTKPHTVEVWSPVTMGFIRVNRTHYSYQYMYNVRTNVWTHTLHALLYIQ